MIIFLKNVISNKVLMSKSIQNAEFEFFSEFNKWTYAVRIGREKGVSQSPTHLPTTENLDIVEYLKKETATE